MEMAFSNFTSLLLKQQIQLLFLHLHPLQFIYSIWHHWRCTPSPVCFFNHPCYSTLRRKFCNHTWLLLSLSHLCTNSGCCYFACLNILPQIFYSWTPPNFTVLFLSVKSQILLWIALLSLSILVPILYVCVTCLNGYLENKSWFPNIVRHLHLEVSPTLPIKHGPSYSSF